MNLERLSLAEWEDVLPRHGVEAFHLPEALSVLDVHTDGELQLLGGFKGSQPVGLLPLVVQNRTFGTVILSPPPSFGVHRLGPIVMPNSPKRRKREQVNRKFIDQIVSEFNIDSSLTLFRTVCNAAYSDPRPFAWNAFNIDVKFTYRLYLDSKSPSELLSSFSKSLRREIRAAKKLDLVLETDSNDGIRAVYDDTKTRYEDQGYTFSLSWDYVDDLTRAFGERCRVYDVRTSDGEFLSGITVLYSNEGAYFWQGGSRTTHENVSINSLLHWEILLDIIEDPALESVKYYDFVGANTERLCRYKSKFGATLVPYYIIESRGVGMDIAKKAYQMIESR